MGALSILSAITAKEERYQQRREERRDNLARIKSGQILSIAAHRTALVRRRMERLHADPDFMLSLREKGLAFDPEGPGRAPQQFPRFLERVLDSNDLMGLRFFEQGLRVARAVGRVHLRDERGAPLGYGTGFLVSPRLLLTNQHVLTSAAQARRCLVEFSYQENASGEIQASEVLALAPAELFLCDEEHDYALVAVAPDPALAAYGWLPLIKDQGKLLVGKWYSSSSAPTANRSSWRSATTRWWTNWSCSSTTRPTPTRAPPAHRCSTTSGRWWRCTTPGCRSATRRARWSPATGGFGRSGWASSASPGLPMRGCG